MGLLSQTNFANQTTADIVAGNTVSFARAGAKTNYNTGADTATGVAEFNPVPAIRFQDAVLVTNHADGSTYPCCVDKLGRVWGTVESGSHKVYILDPSATGGNNVWKLVKDFGATVSHVACSSKTGYIFVGVGTSIYRSTTAGTSSQLPPADDFSVVLTMTGAGTQMAHWGFTDEPGGKVWISEYGGSQDGKINITLTSVTGTFVANDVVTQANSNATAKVSAWNAGTGVLTVVAQSGSNSAFNATDVVSKDGSNFGTATVVSAGFNDATRIYYSSDEGGTWSTIFNLASNAASAGAGYYFAGLHLHKVIYNPTNNTLYFAHGDTDPNYIYKADTGGAGTWTRLTFAYVTYTGSYTYLQPTECQVLSNGDLLWGDDTGRCGMWIHHISDDTFSFVNMNLSGNAHFIAHGQVIDGVRYVASQSQSTDANYLIAMDPDNPANYVNIDRTSGGTVNGWDTIAGKGNDGYIYTGIYSGTNRTTKKIKANYLKYRYGLSVDPISGNGVLDPFDNLTASGDWSSYAGGVHSATGGKYLSTYRIMGAAESNKYTLNNLTDKIVLTVWMKGLTRTGSGPSIRIYIKQYNSSNTYLAQTAIYVARTLSVTEDYWTPFSIQIDPTAFNASTAKITLSTSPVNSTWGACCWNLEQTTKVRTKLSQIASASAADSITTTLPSALPATCTVVGVASVRYQFDAVGIYTLFEAKNAGGTKWVKVIFYNGQIMMIDDSHDQTAPIITTSTGVVQTAMLTTNCLGDLPPDSYFWALQFYNDGSAKVALHVASQRTPLEEPTAVAYTRSNDLTVLYDGCSHTAGEELGGEVLGRGVFDSQLAIADIKELWENQCQWHGPLGFF